MAEPRAAQQQYERTETMPETAIEAPHTCRHRCRTCGVEVIASAQSYAEALNECPLCEERRYNVERVRLRCGNCEQQLERADVFSVPSFGDALYHPWPEGAAFPCGPVVEDWHG